MGFWFKSRCRYTLTSLVALSSIFLCGMVLLPSLNWSFLYVLIVWGSTYASLSSIVPITHTYNFYTQLFSSWALHYLFMFLIVLVLFNTVTKLAKY